MSHGNQIAAHSPNPCSMFPLLSSPPMHVSSILFVIIPFLVQGIFAQHLVDQGAELSSLKFVHAIWRHGARTPTASALIKEADWELGLGELTTKGIGQMYRLGQWIRHRYNGFLADIYNPGEIYVRSSDYNRTLCSAQALLAGLYPPQSNESVSPALNWRPIPVHTESRENDHLLYDSKDCKTMTDLDNALFAGEQATTISRENVGLLRFLAEKLNQSAETPLLLRNVSRIFDPIYCMEQFENGEHPLPEWMNATLRTSIGTLYDLASWLQFSTDKLVRLKAGVLFAEILAQMRMEQKGTGSGYNSRKRLHAYSAHDTTVAGILSAFGVIQPAVTQFPHFTALILIELHKNAQSGDHFVRLFYKNETDVDALWEWPIAECPKPCTLDQLESVRGKMAMKWEEMGEMCGIWSAETQALMTRRTNIHIVLIVLLSLLSTALFLYILFDLVRRRRRKVVKEMASLNGIGTAFEMRWADGWGGPTAADGGAVVGGARNGRGH